MVILEKIGLVRRTMSFLLITGGFFVGYTLVKMESRSATGTPWAYPSATQMMSLENALNEFQEDCGRYPTAREGLRALLERPAEIPADTWRGPYAQDSQVPLGGYEEAVQRARAVRKGAGAQVRETDLAEAMPEELSATAEEK